MRERYWEEFWSSFFELESYVKVLVLVLLSPFWWPCMKAMYREIQATLAPDGGLFGRTPTRRERERIPAREDPLVSVPLATHRRERRARVAEAPGGRASRRGPVRAARRASGFRSVRRRGL